MRSLGGLVLLAGIGVGLFLYLPTPVDRTMSLDRLQQAPVPRAEIARTLETATSGADQAGARTFSPRVQLANFARRAQPASSSDEGQADTATQIDTNGGWHGVVSMAGAPAASLTPSSPDARYKLITDIQQQLKRVGCYWGRIDGSWGVSSKEAMRSFTLHVNAELPIEEPDYLLLTLLQAQNGKACGECPPGLAFAPDGRCLPQPTLAQSRPGDPQQQTASTHETLPWKATGAAQPASPLFTPVATSVVSSEPLPGRMAIGGPKALPPVDAQNVIVEPTAPGTSPVATAALNGAAPSATAAAPSTPPAARRSSYRRSTPDYDPIRRNLLLSLGGAY